MMRSIQQKQLYDQRVALYLDYIRHLDGRLAVQNEILERLNLSFHTLEHWNAPGDQPEAQGAILAAVEEGLQLFRETLRRVRLVDQRSVAGLIGLKSTIEAVSLWRELRTGIDGVYAYDADAVSDQLAAANERLQMKVAAVNAELAREMAVDPLETLDLEISTYDAAQAARSTFLRGDPEAAMAELAATIPELRDAEGVTPWDPQALWSWAKKHQKDGPSSAVRFLLDIWDSDGPWGRFEVIPAFRSWDRKLRSVVLGFLSDSWWP